MMCANTLQEILLYDEPPIRNRDVTADVEGGASSTQAPVSMKELLANRGVFIGCMIFLLQQFSGVNSVVYFSSSVFAKARINILCQSRV